MSNEYDLGQNKYCNGKRNTIIFMYFSNHYKIIKTVNKEHFISLELSNRKDNTSVLCADYDV